MQVFFESLEGRSLFSATPIGVHAASVAPAVIVHPLVALKNMVGIWNGTLSIPGVHDRPVTIQITKQTAAGKLSGTLTTSLDPSIVVAFSGKIRANGKMSITLVGAHSGGAINGAGSGKVSANGKSIKSNLIFTQNGQGFPGTITLAKGTTPTPPVAGGGAGEEVGETGGETGEAD